MTARRVGRWTRLGVGSQVGLAVGLALVAAVLVIQAAEWWYVRFDLSAAGRNTLDPATERLIEKLPQPLVVDVFFRPLAGPFAAPTAQAQDAMLDLLFTAANAHRHQVEVHVHDLSKLQEVQTRQRELGVEGANIVTLSCGERTTTLSLFHDLALIDWGNPTQDQLRYLAENQLGDGLDFQHWSPNPKAYRPPRLSEFRGDEAFAEGLLKVSAATAPKIFFAVGHGEYDLDGKQRDSLARLRAALEGDGFVVEEWKGGGVPSDCDVLALVGARQPYSPQDLGAVHDYVDRGGRLLLAPAYSELLNQMRSGVASLLADYAILARRGVVCEEVDSPYLQRTDRMVLRIGENGLNASHPLTEPLRREGRTVTFVSSVALDRGNPAPGWTCQAIVTSSRDSWLDLPNEKGTQNLEFDAGVETREPRGLCFLAEGPSKVQGTGEEVQRARVLGLGSADALSDEVFDANRDFLLGAFNWLGGRDYRVGVTPHSPEVSLLEVARGPAGRRLSWAVWSLPGLCIGIGLFVAARRRR